MLESSFVTGLLPDLASMLLNDLSRLLPELAAQSAPL